MFSESQITILVIGSVQLFCSFCFYISVVLFRRVSLHQHHWHIALMYSISTVYQLLVIIAQVYVNFYIDQLLYLLIFAFISSAVYSQLRLVGALLPICPLLNANILKYLSRALVVLYLVLFFDKILVIINYTWQVETALVISSVNSIDLVYRALGGICVCAGFC